MIVKNIKIYRSRFWYWILTNYSLRLLDTCSHSSVLFGQSFLFQNVPKNSITHSAFNVDQWKNADELHWFDSVENSFNVEQKNVENQRSTEKDEKLKNTLTLKLKRIETTSKEFQLLHFNVNSARIFFHVSLVK